MDRDEIIKELDEILAIPEVQENEFTLSRLCKRYSISTSGMRYQMTKLVHKGSWATGMRRNPGTGKQVRVWWKVLQS